MTPQAQARHNVLEAKRYARWRALEVSTRQSKTCAQCGIDIGVDYNPKGGKPRKFCSDACAHRFRCPLKPKRPVLQLTCVQCGCSFTRKIRQSTCSSKCQYIRLRELLTGKKYRPAKAYGRTCLSCGHGFIARKKHLVICQRCAVRVAKRGRGKYRERCKLAGVPYVAGVTRDKVFARDGYRCHLCGRRTPKRLRGKNLPTSPELDHIVPINAVGGSPGHVESNVACACRKCNMLKSAKPLGQLRLAV